MKRRFKNICLATTVVLFTACGGGSNNTNSSGTTSNPNTPPPVNYGNNTVGVLQFGLIKNARIEIYKVDASGYRSKKPIFKETTTDGDINHAGFFNTHSSELEDKTYYVYRYTYHYNHGSPSNVDKDTQDIDTNLDGIEDTTYVQMNYGFGANTIDIDVMVRGEWLKNLNGKAFRITPLLHAINRTVSPSGGSSGLYEKFNNMTKEYIKNDINKDGVIDIKDALIFNPVHNRNDAYLAYYDVVQYNEMFDYRTIYEASGEVYSTLKGSLNLATCNPFSGTALRDDTVAITGGDELSIINISDPYDMSMLGKISGDNMYNLVAFSKSSRNILYVKSGSYTPARRKGTSSFIVVDISDASSPKIIAKLGDSIASYRLSADMKQLYILRKGNSIEVYSLEDERQPKLIKTIPVPGDTDHIELSKDKNKLYIVRKPSGFKRSENMRVINTIDILNGTIEVNALTYKNNIVNNTYEEDNLIGFVGESSNKEFRFQCSFNDKFESYTK